MVAALLRRLHRRHVEVRADTVRDEGLRAVDDVFAVLAPRKGLQARHVRAGGRLRDRKRADLVALEPGNDPALLLLLRAELEDRRHRDPGVASDPGRYAARPAARHLLGEHGAVDRVAALAAVLLGVGDPQEAELAHPVEQRARELSCLLPLWRVRPDLLLDEGPQRLAQRLVLLGEGRDQCAHARTPVLGVRPGAVALAHLVPAAPASCGRGRRGRSRAGRPGGSWRRSGDRRAPPRSARRATMNHSVPRSIRRSLPWRGSHQSIVHSITTSSPCSMRVLEVPARVEVLHALLGDLADLLGAPVRAEPRVVVVRVRMEVARDLLDVACVQVAVVGAHALERASCRSWRHLPEGERSERP